MALSTLLLPDPRRADLVSETLGRSRVTEPIESGSAVQRAILTRPITSIVIDVDALSDSDIDPNFLVSLRYLFPSLGIVLLVDPARNPRALFQIGRTGIRNLQMISPKNVARDLERTVRKSEARSAARRVVAALEDRLPQWVVGRLELAMEGLRHRWDVKQFSSVVGVSASPFHTQLSNAGLPAVGALLLWSRIFHACHWLVEPGRSCGTVAGQIGYTGWSLRRALRANLAATPTEVIALGGLPFALERFRQSCAETPQDEVQSSAGA